MGTVEPFKHFISTSAHPQFHFFPPFFFGGGGGGGGRVQVHMGASSEQYGTVFLQCTGNMSPIPVHLRY